MKKIYTVYDQAAGAYLQPFFLDTAGQAIRAFTDCANDQEHLFGKYPDAYTLYHIGTYDESNGNISCISPESMGNALEYVTVPTSNVTPIKE